MHYCTINDIKELNKDSEKFIIGFHFFDAYSVTTPGPYANIFVEMPFTGNEREVESMYIPDKRDVGALLKDVIKDKNMKPVFFDTNKELLESTGTISLFVVYVAIYQFNPKKNIAHLYAETDISCMSKGTAADFNPFDKGTYILKSNNKVIDKDFIKLKKSPVPEDKPNDPSKNAKHNIVEDDEEELEEMDGGDISDYGEE